MNQVRVGSTTQRNGTGRKDESQERDTSLNYKSASTEESELNLTNWPLTGSSMHVAGVFCGLAKRPWFEKRWASPERRSRYLDDRAPASTRAVNH